jgi:hypothetical protein
MNNKDILKTNKLWDGFIDKYEEAFKKCYNIIPEKYVEHLSKLNDEIAPRCYRPAHTYSTDLLDRHLDKLIGLHQPYDSQKNGNYCLTLQFSKEDHAILTPVAMIKNMEPHICIYLNTVSFTDYSFCLDLAKDSRDCIFYDLYEDDNVGFKL